MTRARHSRQLLWTPPGLLLLVAVYATLHLLLRVFLEPSLSFDESEQALFAQSLAWRYEDGQPPLYTWLAWGSFKAFGLNLFSLALVKYSILFGGYVFVFLSARKITDNDNLAALSLYSYGFVAHFARNVHDQMTHTVAATTLLAVTLYLLTRVVESGRWHHYLLLGLSSALGILAKYNFALAIAAGTVAALFVPPFRRRLLDWQIVITAAAATLVIAPHLEWSFEHHNSFLDLLRSSTSAGAASSYTTAVTGGLLKLASKLFTFTVPLSLILPFIFPRLLLRTREALPDPHGYRRFLGYFMLCGIGFLVLLVLLLGAMRFRTH